MLRIAVLAGVFDPIHLGHLDFIERIIAEKSLNKVYLLAEKAPQHKPVFASFADRLKMIELALENHPNIEIYDCDAENYPISHALPEIKKSNASSQIYLLTGHDVAEHIRSWDGVEQLLKNVEIVVANRNDGITSGKIRKSLAKNQIPHGLDPKVIEYIQRAKLYRSETMSGA